MLNQVEYLMEAGTDDDPLFKSEHSQQTGEFLQDLQHALAVAPHRISPKYFYDVQGSELFDRICQLPPVPIFHETPALQKLEYKAAQNHDNQEESFYAR